MSDFSETWKAMSVEQRAKHIVRDWQDSRESNEPMVLRVAAVVAHAVLSEAIVELSNLRAERDEARREVCNLQPYAHHADDIVARLRGGVDESIGCDCVKCEAAAYIERLRAERDEARRRVCENAIQHGRVYRRVGRDTVRCETPQQVAEVMGWDCYKENKENTND